MSAAEQNPTNKPTDAIDPVNIRPRADSDLPGCVTALLDVHRADRYPYRWPADPAAWLSPASSLHAWVAEDGASGAILGHVCVVYGPGSQILASVPGVPVDQLASISRLYVSPTVRGRGLSLGRALLAVAQAWTDAHQFTLTLDVVDDDGAAVRLYEKLGWTLLDRHEADWTTPEGAHPQIRVYRAPHPDGGQRQKSVTRSASA